MIHDTPATAAGRHDLLARVLEHLDLPGGRLTEAALARVVRAVGDVPDLYEDAVVAAGGSCSMTLHLADNFDVRVRAWGPGEATGWHDHSGCSGAFRVLRGGLLERFRDHDGVSLVSRRLGAGAIATFGPAHVHDVVHDTPGVVLSVHAASPPLSSLTRYDWTRYGFVARAVVPEPSREPFVVTT